jgi:tetratricopeptide (TPR) repeat protein/class 3 adenylate cyclase
MMREVDGYIVLADLVSYTKKAESVHRQTGSEGLEILNRQIREYIEENTKVFRSEELLLKTFVKIQLAHSENKPSYNQSIAISNRGDDAVLVFKSAEAAHRFAERLHWHCKEKNKERKRDRQDLWYFRAACAWGKIAVDDYGNCSTDPASWARAIVTRLCPHAEPGEFLIDDRVFEDLSKDFQEKYGAEEEVPGNETDGGTYSCHRWTVIEIEQDMSAKTYLAPMPRVRSREPRDDNIKKIIFMLPASLESENSRRWIKEVAKAQSSINKADNGAGRYEFKFSVDTNASTLSKELSECKPYIVHFSGDAEGIAAAVCGDISSSQSTDVNDQHDKQIGNLFKLHSQDCLPYLECVILSGCNKERQRREIVQYIEFVIEINKELEEKFAIEFVDQFYFHLASKKDVRLAFNLAQEHLERVEKIGKDMLTRIFTRIDEIKCRELEKELQECDEEIVEAPKNIILLRKKVDLLGDLAGLLQDSSRKDEIDSIYNAIASLEPDNYKNRVKQGDALISLGDYQKAESAYDKATESEDGEKDYTVWWKKAIALVKDDEYERASKCYKKALTLLASLPQSSTHPEANSDRYVIYREYGNTLIYLEKTCQGIKSYRNSLRLQPNYRVSNYQKKQAYRKLYSQNRL